MINLPIDTVSNSNPPKFRWRQIVETPVGKTTVEHEGMLPPSVECAVAALIGIVKQLVLENEGLKNEGLKSKTQTVPAKKK